MKKTALMVIRLYQIVLSPCFGGQCRFYPSCSDYTSEAIEKYGTLKGVALGAKRLLKCHPLHPGGVDNVP
jgi:putative membrane protein insertion efficiency factor